MKTLAFLLLLCSMSACGFAQDASKIENIKTLLELTGSGKLGVQVMQNMMASFKETLPEVPEEFWINFMKEVDPNVLSSMVIPIYDKHYTDEDIKTMIEFYETPVGRKVIQTMPQVMQESMQAGQAWGKEIGEKVYNDLIKQGYLKEEDK